jgi:hypothetical protein
MGFNSAFKGLNIKNLWFEDILRYWSQKYNNLKSIKNYLNDNAGQYLKTRVMKQERNQGHLMKGRA